MGELLRATLEQSCVWSRPRWYGARILFPSAGAFPVSRSTTTTFDKTGYFLLTAFYVGMIDVTAVGPQTNWGLPAGSLNMQLQNSQSGQEYYYNPVSGPVGGPMAFTLASYLASPVELEEYPVFGPGERLKWTLTRTALVSAVGAAIPADICYAGIEYLMPGGFPNG